ncbi:MAG: DUF4003 domain-containing protein [Lachnospiraceae bacterium]|nr:DUF4003 domain-containing protein [Lachnospiraceae bacterium]
MKNTITNNLDLFISNKGIIKRGFTWHNSMTKRLAALIYTLENKTLDYENIERSHRLIKDNTGIFSSFKGSMSLCIATMLSLNNSKEQLFAEVLSVYDSLKKAKFRASDYLAVSAFLIAANTEKDNYTNTVERTKAFYNGMKKNSRLRTGEDDYIFAVMFALSDIEVITGTERMEQLYQRLKKEFKRAGGNSIQTLSQVLALGGKTDEALEHLLILRKVLKKRKIRMDKTYTLPALGVLSLLPLDGDSLADNLLEAQNYLRAQKGFGKFSVPEQELLLYSSALISVSYAKEMKGNVAASITNTITNIIIAQQVAIMIAAISASTAAAASSG